MSIFASSVRFTVKPECVNDFRSAFEKLETFEGVKFQRLVQTGDHTFLSFSEWESEEMLAAARPTLIAFLDTFRGLLEEISPDLGMTDPVSGPVVVSR
jgi:hypothetical protein